MADITLSNFELEVIEASRRQPVLLDIWAPWCGPCKTLGPMLEKLETAYAGRFVLAKLDADQQPEIAGQLSRMFGVRSIPLCVLFQDGQPVDGFVGALPESELRAFLDKHVPSADAVAGQDDAERAREMLAAGHVDDGIAALKHALELDPANDGARCACLLALIRAGRLAEAREVHAPVAGRGTTPATDDLAAAGLWLEACEQAAAADAAPEATPQEQRFRRARAHLAAAHFTEALDELLEILMRDKNWGEGRARTLYLAILRLMRATQAEAEPEGAAPGAIVPAGATAARRASDADTYHRRLSMILF